MQKIICCLCCLVFTGTLFAKEKRIVTNFAVADSMRPAGLLLQLTVQAIQSKKEMSAGLEIDGVRLAMETERKKRTIVFQYPASAILAAKGHSVDASEAGELEWVNNWTIGEAYQLYIATSSDSAENFTLYSGYIYLPQVQKWKLIGTCKVAGKWGFIKEAKSFLSNPKKDAWQVNTTQTWLQRTNGTWKNLIAVEQQPPVLGAFTSVDSSLQAQTDYQSIQDAIAIGKTEKLLLKENVFYSLIKEGSGNKVLVTDTVTVFYKGYLFNSGIVFDQTKEKPANFPLNRLIKGWQIALTECKVGGKIMIVIPSGLSYGIRTRSPKIPPNSILVFEIEVVAAKPK